MDLRTLKKVREGIESKDDQIACGNGYDHNWVLNVKVGISLKKPRKYLNP